MTDNQYGNGYPTPSSRPPEPPFRSDMAFDAPSQAHVSSGAGQAVDGQVDQWQYYRQDISGVDVPGDVASAGEHGYAGAPDSTESFAAARSGDTGRIPRTSAASYGPGQGAQGAYTPYGSQTAAYQHAVAPAQAAPAKKAPSAGKMFLFGFLGALVACALAIGGFALANGGIIRTQASSATIGTTDQTVIDAVDQGQTLAEAVAAKTLPSVVAIYNYQDMSQMYNYGYGYGYGTQGGDSLVAVGMGSGVVISDEGYILTNYHVVEDAAKLTVTVDGKERDAKYIGGDNSSDVAVIQVEDTAGLVAADIGDSDSLVIGEWVMTVGAPLGLEQSVATGVVSATNRDTVMNGSSSANDPYSQMFGYTNAQPEYVYYPNMIQTDAVINPGNSGGALVDADGKLIGINSIISSQSGDYAGVGFAIPINYAIGIAKDVIDGKEPTHAMLGVSLSQVNSTIAQRYNLSADKGAYISAITPDTGAADSDLQVGDIITAVDGKPVTSATDVTLDVRAHKVGDTVTVTVNRGGESVDVEVKLTSDENLVKTNENDQKQQQAPQGGGQDNDRDQGQGRGNGYSEEDLERLMDMLGF